MSDELERLRAENKQLRAWVYLAGQQIDHAQDYMPEFARRKFERIMAIQPKAKESEVWQEAAKDMVI